MGAERSAGAANGSALPTAGESRTAAGPRRGEEAVAWQREAGPLRRRPGARRSSPRPTGPNGAHPGFEGVRGPCPACPGPSCGSAAVGQACDHRVTESWSGLGWKGP